MRLHLAIVTLGLLVAGCQTTPPPVQERVIYVPSSKPYRYITIDPEKDSKKTIEQVIDHNLRHAAVKRKEKEAKERQKP